jgi:acetyl esterase/lipase
MIFAMANDILTLPPPPTDRRIAYGSDPNQVVDLRLPKQRNKPVPLVINIHGGFWRAKYTLDHAGHLCAALTAKGLATANIEYRRVGNDGGGWPETFSDVRAAHSFLVRNAHRHNFDVTKLVVIGHSAGGQLALCLAAHEPSVTRVVSLAGVVDLRRAYQLHLSNHAVAEFLRGTPAEVPDHYREADPMQLFIPQANQWLMHGAADDVVPPEFSRDYVAAKNGRAGKDNREEVHLIELASADHFDLIDPRSAAWKQVEQTALQLVA